MPMDPFLGSMKGLDHLFLKNSTEGDYKLQDIHGRCLDVLPRGGGQGLLPLPLTRWVRLVDYLTSLCLQSPNCEMGMMIKASRS